jgi:hypothetical protein
MAIKASQAEGQYFPRSNLRNKRETANNHPNTTGCATSVSTTAIRVRSLRVFGGASEGSMLLNTMMAYQIAPNDMTEKKPHRKVQTVRVDIDISNAIILLCFD